MTRLYNMRPELRWFAARYMLYGYDEGNFDKRHNLEVSFRNEGTLNVAITINQTMFGIDLTADQADDFADSVKILAQRLRENGELYK